MADIKSVRGALIVDSNTQEIPFRVYGKHTKVSIGYFFTEADAMLFAVASDLLEALESAVAGYKIPDVWLEQARAAIAKARGQ